MTMPISKQSARLIHLTPFGLHTRYMLAAYLRHTLMVAGALMAIALTIDLWPQVALLSADPRYGGASLVWNLARLAALRISDLLPPFIPFATFLGVVWTECAFTESRERMLIWNSGRPPLLCLTPALMLGLVMGVALFALDAWVRPAAIGVQIREQFGREGIRLDRTKSGGNHWIALPDGLLRAEIEYGPPLRLHNVTVYKLDREGHLAEVDTAALASPLPGNRWLLQGGHYWRADAPPPSFTGGTTVTLGNSAQEEAEILFDKRTVSMTLNKLWLSNLGMSPQYIPLPMLRALAASRIVSHDDAGFRTRLQALYSEPLLPVAMALLAAALAMLVFPYRIRPVWLIGVLLAGYLSHFAARAFLLMGEFGYVWSWVAGWFVPLALLAMTGGVLWAIEKRRVPKRD
jgi:lipopolysaccharide export LptBFGC system permease protein LptF